MITGDDADVDRITNHVLGDACTPGNAKECTFETVRPVVDHCMNGDLDDLLADGTSERSRPDPSAPGPRSRRHHALTEDSEPQHPAAAPTASRRDRPSFADVDEVCDAARRARLPRRRATRHDRLPGDPRSTSRCCSRARPASARPSSRRALAEATGRRLLRLQCYEGQDETKALYEWDYGKQLLYTQILREKIGELVADAADLAEAVERIARAGQSCSSPSASWPPRPLLEAIRSEEPVVLLIDEVDRADEALEAVLLELLARVPGLHPRDRHRSRASTRRTSS